MPTVPAGRPRGRHAAGTGLQVVTCMMVARRICIAMGATESEDGPVAYPVITGGHCKTFNDLANKACSDFEEKEKALQGKGAEAKLNANKMENNQEFRTKARAKAKEVLQTMKAQRAISLEDVAPSAAVATAGASGQADPA